MRPPRIVALAAATVAFLAAVAPVTEAAPTAAVTCVDPAVGLYVNGDGILTAIVNLDMPHRAFGRIRSVDYTLSYVTVPNVEHRRRVIKTGLSAYHFEQKTRLRDAEPGLTSIELSGTLRTGAGTACKRYRDENALEWL